VTSYTAGSLSSESCSTTAPGRPLCNLSRLRRRPHPCCAITSRSQPQNCKGSSGSLRQPEADPDHSVTSHLITIQRPTLMQGSRHVPGPPNYMRRLDASARLERDLLGLGLFMHVPRAPRAPPGVRRPPSGLTQLLFGISVWPRQERGQQGRAACCWPCVPPRIKCVIRDSAPASVRPGLALLTPPCHHSDSKSSGWIEPVTHPDE
jgi:hypothetical protein